MRAQEFIVEYRKNAMVGGIDLSFEYDDKFGESAKVQAFSNGRKLGYAEFLVVRDRELEATDLEVDERYRGQGIARLMYDFVKQQGYKIHRSHAQTTDGSKFWDKNRGEDARVWEQELSEFAPNPNPDPWGGNDFNLSWNNILNIYRKFFDGQGWDQELGSNSAQFFNRDDRVFSIQQAQSPQIYHYAMVRNGKHVMKGFSHATLNSTNHVIGRIQNQIQGKQELSEISRDRLERYLDRAGRQVDTRQERMALARQRLNTSYEIYHAEHPTKIVDRFEADTPADAQRYYQEYIERYESDVDYDLRLRRGTGIMESYQRKLNFDEIYGKYLKVTDNAGDPNKKGFSLVTPLNGDSWNWRERPEFIPIVKKKLNQPGWLGNHKYQQIIDAMAGRGFDPKRHIAEFAPSPERDNNDEVPDPIFVLANRWWNAAEKQPQIESVLNSMGWSIHQVESEDDAVQLQHRDGTTYFISADDFDPDVFENFADGKVKGKSRPGRVKRSGASCNGSVTDLRRKAKNASGEKAKMYHWCANMKSGRKKNK